MAILLNEQEKKWLIENYANYSNAELKKIYNCGTDALREVCKKLGITYTFKRYDRWLPHEITYLKNNLDKKIKENQMVLDRSYDAIVFKRTQLLNSKSNS